MKVQEKFGGGEFISVPRVKRPFNWRNKIDEKANENSSSDSEDDEVQTQGLKLKNSKDISLAMEGTCTLKNTTNHLKVIEEKNNRKFTSLNDFLVRDARLHKVITKRLSPGTPQIRKKMKSKVKRQRKSIFDALQEIKGEDQS